MPSPRETRLSSVFPPASEGAGVGAVEGSASVKRSDAQEATPNTAGAALTTAGAAAANSPATATTTTAVVILVERFIPVSMASKRA